MSDKRNPSQLTELFVVSFSFVTVDIVKVGSSFSWNSLVGLQLVYGDEHAFLVEPSGRILLGHLLTLLGLVVAWLLGQPEKIQKIRYNTMSGSWPGLP